MQETKQPFLSIIVPIYKAEMYLSECLDSIIGQTFTDFELILVDDGSPDNCGIICDNYSNKDQRIRVIHKINGGASSARNAGVNVAQGKYIGWVDADDRISPSMYEKLYYLAEQYQADIAGCQHLEIRDKIIVRSGKEEPDVFGRGDFILQQFFNAQMKPALVTKIYRREIWKGICFPEGRNHQDCYVNMRFALMPLLYARTSEPLYFYIIREKSITTTYTSFAIRQAIYLYDYTMNLAKTIASTDLAKRLLTKDAINRLMGRYFEITVNSTILNQNVYNRHIRKKLGFSLIRYLILTKLPIKTKISYMLLLFNMKRYQVFFHNLLGKKRKFLLMNPL